MNKIAADGGRVRTEMSGKKQRVVVVGASPSPGRYSNEAVQLLIRHGHEVVPINPHARTIEGLPVLPDLAEVCGPVDTVTLYVSAKISSTLTTALKELQPGRVIFNPGAENPALCQSLAEQGIPTENACTLVLLNTHQF